MEKMKNVIFWDNDINERKRALGKLRELGYNCDKCHNGGDLVYGIDRYSDLRISLYKEYYDNPILYNSAAEFIEALEDFHKPKMRYMTKDEIYKLYRANDGLWIKHQYGKEWVSRISQISPKSDEAFFTWEGWAEWQTYDSLIKNFKYAIGKYAEDWHEFKVEE